MQNYFYELADQLFQKLTKDEVLLLNYAGEDSDFVRLNHNKIRQAGFVRQQSLDLQLIANKRQATAVLQLSGDLAQDLNITGAMLDQLRNQIEQLPPDPFINYAETPTNTENISADDIPEATEILSHCIEDAKGLDLVGLWASGELSRGFANSLGQRNWHSSRNFNFDWSIYHHDDKAIKQNIAGVKWEPEYYQQKMAYAKATLSLLQTPEKQLNPGKYRVFISPSAMQELMDMLNWGGFGLKAHRTSQTPLLKMITGDHQLNPVVSLREDNRSSLAPVFTSNGFIKPQTIEIIQNGSYANCLVDARSSIEYGQPVNCSSESAQSLILDGGNLHQDNIFKAIDTGIFISNLWYCNFSDRSACRITGMTRFACLWVENGKPIGPLGVMRFDESIYNILGDNLLDLTIEQEHIVDTNTYGSRSLNNSRLPGALVDNFRLTL